MISLHLKGISTQWFILFIMLASIGIGVFLPFLLSGGNSYIETRILYGSLAILSIAFIFYEYMRYRWLGFVTPLTMTLAGFFYFFFFTPIFNPGIIPSLYLTPERYFPIVLVIGLGIFGFIVGYYFPNKFTPKFLNNWLNKSVSPRRLSQGVLMIVGIYILIGLYMASIGNFSPIAFILQSRYTSLVNNVYEVQFQGSAYYLFQIFRWLPIAISSPGAYCLFDRRLSMQSRFLIVAGLSLMILVALGQGVRYIFSFILGSIIIIIYIEYVQQRIRGGLVRTRVFLLLVFMLISVLFQLQTRSAGGFYTILSGENSFDVYQSISTFTSDIAADQNYTLEGILNADKFGILQYAKGESYLLNFVMFIPRQIWPGKPGEALAEKLRVANPFYIDNVSYSVLGELIFNFGRYSIFPGMLLGGILSRFWWNIFFINKDSVQMVTLYAMSAVPLIFIVRGSFATMFGGIMYPMLLTIFLLEYSTWRRGASA